MSLLQCGGLSLGTLKPSPVTSLALWTAAFTLFFALLVSLSTLSRMTSSLAEQTDRHMRKLLAYIRLLPSLWVLKSTNQMLKERNSFIWKPETQGWICYKNYRKPLFWTKLLYQAPADQAKNKNGVTYAKFYQAETKLLSDLRNQDRDTSQISQQTNFN